MPTPVPPLVQQAYLNIVAAAPYPGGPYEVDRITSSNLLAFYEDVASVLYRQIELFEANNAYLVQAISVFDPTLLQSVGIWFNVTVGSSPPLADPVLIINSTCDLVVLNPNVSSPPAEKTLAIWGPSNISLIKLVNGTILDQLWLGPGSTVDSLNASTGTLSPPTYTAVNTIWIRFARSTPSALNSVVYESVIHEVVQDEGSYYGGVQENPNVTCPDAVTNMQVTEVTNRGLLVSWTPPASYLFINTFYKKTNSQVWILAIDVDGDFVDPTGFVFRHLEDDTWYDFRAAVVCTNGGLAYTQITTQTSPSGLGAQLNLYKVCPITMIISNSPDSPPTGQALCNGVAIDLHYPVGSTITIPYLATVNSKVLNPFVINNVPYQNFPYDPSTGTWDASTTPVMSFTNGDVITVNVSLPA